LGKDPLAKKEYEPLANGSARHLVTKAEIGFGTCCILTEEAGVLVVE
jgi:hypothetical protein